MPRWQGGVATVVVAAVTIVLVVLDVVDRAVRRFWAAHALTVDTTAGLLVVAVTVLIVDQVVTRRQLAERSRVVAAQAAIVLAQARRSVKGVESVQDGSGDRASAADEMRTYLLMLLVAAPVLIEDPLARRFLEHAQRLGAELARVLVPAEVATWAARIPTRGLEDAIEKLRAASSPLLQVLTPDERWVVSDTSA